MVAIVVLLVENATTPSAGKVGFHSISLWKGNGLKLQKLTVIARPRLVADTNSLLCHIADSIQRTIKIIQTL
jgi:hypothetical protein